MRLIAYILLTFGVVAGVYWANVNNELNIGDECTLLKNECVFLTSKGEFRLKFEQEPVAEEELAILFDMPDGVIVKSAQVQGVNMFMGKTPVLFEEGLPENTAVTFLGSCNLAEMKWVLTVDYEIDGTQDSVSVFFSTYQ